MQLSNDNFDHARYPDQFGLFFSEDCASLSTYFAEASYAGATRWYTFKLDGATGSSYTADAYMMPFLSHNSQHLIDIPQEAQQIIGEYMFMTRKDPDPYLQQSTAFESVGLSSIQNINSANSMWSSSTSFDGNLSSGD